ncbi:MAG: PGPGW domain-containing protein [Nocardioides sp.]
MAEVDQRSVGTPPGASAGHRFARLKRLHARAHANPITAFLTKVVVTIVGLFLVAIGVVMIFTPGQGILAIIAGLALLSTEYHWAKRLLRRARASLDQARERARAIDPRVRRRRIVGTAVATTTVVAALVAHLVVYDWPQAAVVGWDWVQGISQAVPELPGM